LFCTFTHPIAYTIRMKNEKTPQMVQAECDACDQILTLDESPIGLTLCIACAKDYETDLDTLQIVHDYYADPKV